MQYCSLQVKGLNDSVLFLVNKFVSHLSPSLARTTKKNNLKKCFQNIKRELLFLLCLKFYSRFKVFSSFPPPHRHYIPCFF